jgi:multimeric flavodoxin WrbA
MKILAINGSPSGTHGATWWVLEKFLKGIEAAGEKAEVIHLAGKKIHSCAGELACWLKTPGKCIYKDDMEPILAAINEAEALVVATPVYVDGMTGLLKNCIDRMVPTADPHIEFRDGHCRHAGRNESRIKRVALVSVCGFFELDNFDPLVTHVKAICRNMGADYAGAVLRPAAPMFPSIPTIHPLFFKIRAVTKAFEQAGREFAASGKISDEAARAAGEEVVSKDKYVEECNKWFDKELAKIKT